MITSLSSNYRSICSLFNFGKAPVYKCRKISLKELMKEVKDHKVTTTSEYRKYYKKYKEEEEAIKTYLILT